jgi:ubiquitin C-terminal hydrolase
MHKELNNKKLEVKNSINLGETIESEINEEKYNYFNINGHLINSKEEVNRTNEIEVRLKFVNEILSKMNSPISNNFKALKKITNICEICNNITYIFNCYFFVIIDIEKILLQIKSITSSELDLVECLKKTIVTKKEIYCDKCLKKTLNKIEEIIFSFPKLLIIYIERGVNFKYKTKFCFKEEIELYDSQIKTKKKYLLVGLIKRKHHIDEYFSIINLNLKWFISDKNKLAKIKSIWDNNEGDVIMFFYQELELLKEDEKYLKIV